MTLKEWKRYLKYRTAFDKKTSKALATADWHKLLFTEPAKHDKDCECK
jgi:hypothetical protein